MAYRSFNWRDGTLTILDNTPTTPKSVTVTLEEGGLTLTIPEPEVIDVRDRGQFDHLRKGDPKPMTFSFSSKHNGLVAAAADTLFEALTGVGSSWVYTAKTGSGYDLADGGDVPLVQIKLAVTQGGGTVETIEIPNCALPSIVFAENSNANTISISGTSYQELPIVTVA